MQVMETKSYRCYICKVDIRSTVDLIRAVRKHMKVMHSNLAGGVLSDDEILNQPKG